jgi:hypothetical protein
VAGIHGDSVVSKKRKRRGETLSTAWSVTDEAPPSTPERLSERTEPTEGARTYQSVFVDAVTAAAFLFGVNEAAKHCFQVADFSKPIGLVVEKTVQTWPMGLVFICLFHFLIDDWQEARYIDSLSPQHPSPRGFRFFFDLLIATGFIGSFAYARLADVRLLLLMSVLYALSVLWCIQVLLAADRREAVANSVRFAVAHLASAAIFFVFYMLNRRKSTMSDPTLYWLAGLYLLSWMLEQACRWLPSRWVRPLVEGLATKFYGIARGLSRVVARGGSGVDT